MKQRLPGRSPLGRAFQSTEESDSVPEIQLRVPFFPSQQGRNFVTSEVFPNLLLTTLAVTAPNPFIPPDFGGLQARQTIGSEVFTNSLLLQPAPFIALDFGRLQPRSSVQSEAYSSLLTTLLAPQVIAAPFIPVDFSVLARRQSVQDALIVNILILGIPPAVPFRPNDQSAVPRGTNYRSELQPNLLTSTLAPPAQAPFSQPDFSSAQRLKSAASELIANTVIGGIPPSIPFYQADLTGKLLRIASVQSEAFPSLLVTTLTPPLLTTPFKWVEVENRKRLSLKLDVDYPNPLLPALPPPPPAVVPSTDTHEGWRKRRKPRQESYPETQVIRESELKKKLKVKQPLTAKNLDRQIGQLLQQKLSAEHLAALANDDETLLVIITDEDQRLLELIELSTTLLKTLN